jgi:hypothetical protein
MSHADFTNAQLQEVRGLVEDLRTQVSQLSWKMEKTLGNQWSAAGPPAPRLSNTEVFMMQSSLWTIKNRLDDIIVLLGGSPPPSP